AFPVVTIWGFSARWLPVFLGLGNPKDRLLLAALVVNVAAVGAVMGGWWIPATTLFVVAAGLAITALRVFRPSVTPPKISGVHPTFPLFVRLAYGWLLVSAALSVAAALADRAGGLWGASRHALTVGYMATMVFSIGQRVLPAFCGMRVLRSPRLMFWSLALLNLGCFLRVGSEIGAYESYMPSLWPLLLVSAVIEMTAVTVFACNLILTFRQQPAHVAGTNQSGWRVKAA
ncbi:MAG: NnrS family protein, partial [Bryobacteraceae bacterium]